MKGWKLTGLVATVIIILSIPFYLLKVTVIGPPGEEVSAQQVQFVGSKKCQDCHKKEYDKMVGFPS